MTEEQIEAQRQAYLADHRAVGLAMVEAPAPVDSGRASLATRLADVHYFEMPAWAHEAIDEALAALTDTGEEPSEAAIRAAKQSPSEE